MELEKLWNNGLQKYAGTNENIRETKRCIADEHLAGCNPGCIEHLASKHTYRRARAEQEKIERREREIVTFTASHAPCQQVTPHDQRQRRA